MVCRMRGFYPLYLAGEALLFRWMLLLESGLTVSLGDFKNELC